MVEMILFATFVSLAMPRRRNAQAHERLVLLATVGLIAAAIARGPGGLAPGPLAF
jgi:predicted branched-subunit amino acid permease